MSSRQPLDVSGDALAVVKASWRLIARLVRDQPVAYAIAATGAVVFTSAIVASALVIGKVTDDLIVPVLERGEPLDGGLRLAVVLIVGVAVVKAVGIVVRRTAAYWLQGVAQARLRKRLIGHQFELSLRWYGSRATGDLLSVVDNDARQTTFVLAPLPFATGVVFLLVGSVVVITLTDVWLGLAGLVLLAAVVALDIRGSWLTFEAMAEAQVRRGRVGDTAHESFDGALTVKALGREQVEADRFRAVVYRLRDQLIDVGRVWTLYRAVTEALPAIGTVLILYLGVVRIATGALTTGELVRVAYLLSLLAVPVRLIGYLLWDAAHSVAGWQRVEEVLTAGDRVAYGDEPPRRRGAGPAPVRVDGVGFGYDDGSPVLEDVELDVPAGRTLAVVGPTASGKSTLARLLVRLWDPVDGAIRLDGRDLRSLRPGGVAREVAFVAQDTFLFDDTVAGNIALGRDVPREVVEVAARRAAAEQFIARLPDGYDTRVGERGTTLSGGQQQRVALARALAGRPRLLVLDDATSAVDPSVEVRILERLKAAPSPATVVVVAYRRSTIALADEVAYVEGGRIRAYGTHEELLATEPGYAELLQAYEFEGDERRAATGPAAGPSRGGGRR